MFYSPIIRFKPVIQYKHHLFREVFIMDKNSEKEKLNDELLNKVSGGCGEVDVILVGELTCPNCEGLFIRQPSGVTELRCKWCQI